MASKLSVRVSAERLRVDTAGWTVESGDFVLTMTTSDAGAHLEVSAFDVGHVLDSEELLAIVRRRVPANAIIEEASCGEFSGYTYRQVNSDQAVWQEWWLSLAEALLSVRFHCDADCKGKYSDLLNRTLTSLRDFRP